MISFKSSYCCKIVSDHLQLSFNASYEVFLCSIGVKYLCALMHLFFENDQGVCLLEHEC